MASMTNWIFTTLWTLILAPLRILDWFTQSDAEAYSSLDHVALNVKRPETEWMNMGNWADTDEFPQACENLAKLLYKEAGLTNSCSILDVGHGSGDSLLLLSKEYAPTLLHGVTSAKGHAIRAQKRLKENGHTQNTEIFHNDAVAFLNRSKEPLYDFIFALDCAYHFQTRQDFLKLCFQRLRPGGKVALVDLTASHPYPSTASNSFFTPSPTLPPPKHSQAPLSNRIKHAITTILTGVPLGNLISIDAYHSHLINAGFQDITIKDTSHLVFPGFARFLKQYGIADEATWRGGGALQGIALRSFGSTVQDWSLGADVGMVRSVVVVAVKR